MASSSEFQTLCDIIQAQQARWSDKNIEALLGSHPWDEDTLLKCYCGSQNNTRNIIESLQGYKATSIYFGLNKSFNILQSHTEDLLSHIESLKSECKTPLFWDVTNPRLSEIKFFTEKSLFAASSAAAALIDHQRRIKNSGYYTQQEHSEALNNFFDGTGLAHFVIGLRNCMTHCNIIDCDWMIEFGVETKEKKTSFYLKNENLLKYDWANDGKSDVISFIESHKFGVNIHDVFTEWILRSKKYHEWLSDILLKKYKKSMEQYSSYEKILYYDNLISLYSIIKKSIRYDICSNSILSKDELAAVLSMQSRKEQRQKLQVLYEDKYKIDPLKRIFG